MSGGLRPHTPVHPHAPVTPIDKPRSDTYLLGLRSQTMLVPHPSPQVSAGPDMTLVSAGGQEGRA